VDKRRVQACRKIVVQIYQFGHGVVIGFDGSVIDRRGVGEVIVVIDVGQLEERGLVEHVIVICIGARSAVGGLKLKRQLLVHEIVVGGREIRCQRVVGVEKVGQDITVKGDLA